jgi:hypothetical protein
VLASYLVLASGCAPRARMCVATADCADKGTCVAGRCQIEKPTVRPAVESAKRLVVRPVDLAYVKSGDAPSGGALPPLVALGKDGGKLLLRFEAPIPTNAKVIEAYVVLHRSTIVDDDPSPVSLHGTRIVEAWSGRSVSWAFQPRLLETRSPSTVVEPGGAPLVRLDVRELVRHWARRDPADQGIAIVAEGETPTGATFALNEIGAPIGARELGPYLELYLR